MKILKVLKATIVLTLLTSLWFTSPASAAQELARQADSFVDSVGVNVHLTYAGTPYLDLEGKVIPKLQEAGIRHIRDGGYSGTDFANKIKRLGAKGIQSNIIFSGNSMTEMQSIASGLVGGIKSIEGPNESDLPQFNFSYNGQGFPQGTLAYQTDLYNTIKNNSNPELKTLPIGSASMGHGENGANIPGLGAYADHCSMHNYPNIGQPPMIDLDTYFLRHANTMCGTSIPKWSTETGYHNVVAAGSIGINEDTAGRYIPRLLLGSFNRNIKRTYLYEMYDQGTSTTDSQSNYGLLRNNNTPKPAYTAIKNLNNLLKEPGVKFAPGVLDYSITGNTTDINKTLLQKSNKEFYLILWQEVRSWNHDTRTNIPVAWRDLTINLNTPIRRADIYKPRDGAKAIQTLYAPSGSTTISSINLSGTTAVPDHPLVIKLTPLSNQVNCS